MMQQQSDKGTTPRAVEEGLYRQLFEASGEAMIVIDDQGCIALASPPSEALFGYHRTELTGKPVEVLLAQSDREGHLIRAALVVAQREGPMGAAMRLRARRKDGSLFAAEVSLRPLPGPPEGMVAAQVQDLGEAVHVDGRAGAMLGAAPIGVCVVDADGIFARVNGTCASLLGYHPDELLGLPFTVVLPPDAWEEAVSTFQQALASGSERASERTLRRKDGTSVTVLIASIPVVGPDGHPQRAIFAVDIEERRRAEEALGRLAALVTSTSDAVIFVARDRTITSWNAGAERLYGYTAAEAVGRPIGMLVVPSDPDVAERIQGVLLRGEPVVDLDAVRRHKDGSLVPVSISVSPVRDASGTIIGGVSSHRDISARKAVEEALHVSEERYRRIVETANEGIVQVDLEGRVQFLNQRAADIAGFSRAEMLGQSILSGVAEDDQAAVRALLASRRQGTHDTFRYDVKIRHKDGSLIWAAMSDSAMTDAAGQVVGALGLLTDITARKATEEALARANAELETILRVLPIGIGIADDPAVSRIRMNPTFARMLGLPLGANASLTAPEGERPTSFRVYQGHRELAAEELPFNVAAATGQEVRDLELEVVREDGARLTQLVNAAPLFDEQGRVRGAVGAHLDISARALAERQRDLLLVGMAHDLKNPLSALVWLAEVLQRRATELEEVRLLDRFVRGARQILAQINEFVDTTRGQLGRPLELELRRVDLAALVTRLAAEQARMRLGRRIVVEGTHAPLPGLYDEARVARALTNVLGNALKFSAPDGEVSIQLARADGGTGDWVVVRVADRGIGIPAAEVGRVFEPFYRASNARPGQEGSGLGLAGVRQVVEAHGGSVELESEEGVGTTVTIRLPLRPPGWPDAAEEAR